jgi:cob(I)alamin adenosyltransferase
MKIYTKKGDTGQTSLIGGTRVLKSHLRIETYGTVDELNSYLGLLRTQSIAEPDHALFTAIQSQLFTIGSYLASDPETSKMQLPPLEESFITRLEQSIDTMEAQLPALKNFILPGGHPANAIAHVARCVCRRAERLTVALNELSPINPIILALLNRLSDWLFVYARWASFQTQSEEIPWVSGAGA